MLWGNQKTYCGTKQLLILNRHKENCSHYIRKLGMYNVHTYFSAKIGIGQGIMYCIFYLTTELQFPITISFYKL